MTINAVKNCDINFCRFENEITIINKFSSPNSINTDWYNAYTDFHLDLFWSKAISGKRVLIISSFNETIKFQLSKKTNDAILFNHIADAEFIYYDTLETQFGLTNEFSDWFSAYEKVRKDISQIEFDIAIIAMGAYGYILASDIKNMGKQAIELCSGLYPLFFIKNKTQAIIRRVSKMYDANWIFPIDTPPENYLKIEKGAYWE